MIFWQNLLRIFKKDYNLYAYNMQEGTKHLIQFFNNEKDAVEYLERLLDSKLKDFCIKTKDENTLADDFLNSREHEYKIENSTYNDVSYIKNNAQNIYSSLIGKNNN